MPSITSTIGSMPRSSTFFQLTLLGLLIGLCLYDSRNTNTQQDRGNISPHSIKICFHDNDGNERGTSAAVYDYADFTEKLLGYRVHIIFPESRWRPKAASSTALLRSSIPRFQQRFNVSFYKPLDQKTAGTEALPAHALAQGCSILYMIKAGGLMSPPAYPESFDCRMPTAVHAVFSFEKHGHTYAAVNEGITRGNRGDKPTWRTELVVPHLVREPNPQFAQVRSLHEELNIPTRSLVICRMGGWDTFDVPQAHRAVAQLVERYQHTPKLFFLFLNTKPFLDNIGNNNSSNLSGNHSYAGIVRFLPAVTDDYGKARFFRTCDAMLHGRSGGETFGLAVAEFSIRNKPVLTYAGPDNSDSEKFHLKALGAGAFVYESAEDIVRIVVDWVNRGGVPTDRRYDGYRQYSPDKVMHRFEELFLRPILDNNYNEYHLLRRCKDVNATRSGLGMGTLKHENKHKQKPKLRVIATPALLDSVVL